MSGDFDNLPGILRSFDPVTGGAQWTFYSSPVPGTPGSISGGATGGQMWMTGTYDPDLNLLYVGTDDGALWVTRDGGQKWQRLLDNALPGLNRVQFLDAKTGYLLGDGADAPDLIGYLRTLLDYASDARWGKRERFGEAR